jgi:EPS-associated MarR family transcriptional regulator
MAERRSKQQEDSNFWVLKLLQENPDMTQRELAKALGISLGGVNYCLKALVDKGWVKMQNFGANESKLSYAYLLTPTGVAEKISLTARFLRRKIQEYEDLKAEIEALQNDMQAHSVPELAHASDQETK